MSDTIWKDEITEYPNRYSVSDNEGGTIDITPSKGRIYQDKTLVNAKNLDTMQDRINEKWGDNPNVDVKIEWKDHKVEHPNRYRLNTNSDGTVDIIPAKGDIIQQGTPVNAETLNKLENRIDNMINIPTDATAEQQFILAGKTAYVGQMEKITGIMPDNGSLNLILTKQNEECIIPKGYHNGEGRAKVEVSNLAPYNIRYGAAVGGVVGKYPGNLFKFIKFGNDDTKGRTNLPSSIAKDETCEVPPNSQSIRHTVYLGWRPDGIIISYRDSNYSLYTDVTKGFYITSDWTGEIEVGDTVNDTYVYLTDIVFNNNGLTFKFKQDRRDYNIDVDMSVFAYQLNS